MLLMLEVGVWTLVVFLLIPALIVFCQSLLALIPVRPCRALQLDEPVDAVVIIPAHNEEAGIHRTIRSVMASADDRMRVLVVADNCTDRTAEVAKAAGAEVIERFHATDRGKAFALGFATAHLQSNPPEVVVVVDADCLVGPPGFTRLARRAVRLQRPIQSLNLIDRRRKTSHASAISTLGNRWHNLVRPMGLAKIGLPCLLTGSGMAFPWICVERVGLQNTSLGEDKQLGIDMALAGFPPLFSLDAKVASYVPDRYEGYVGQRTRWEHGHLLVAVTQIPRLLWRAVRTGSFGLITMALDLAVPPLALLAGQWMLAAAITFAWGCYSQDWRAAICVAAATTMFAVALLVTWAGFSRRRVPLQSLLMIPWYMLGKFPIYLRFLTHGPERRWLRTERANETR